MLQQFILSNHKKPIIFFPKWDMSQAFARTVKSSAVKSLAVIKGTIQHFPKVASETSFCQDASAQLAVLAAGTHQTEAVPICFLERQSINPGTDRYAGAPTPPKIAARAER